RPSGGVRGGCVAACPRSTTTRRVPYELDFVPFCSVTHRMSKLSKCRTRQYNDIRIRGRCGKTEVAPQMPPHEGQAIAAGRRLFVLPGSLLEGKRSLWSQRMPKAGPQAVAPQEQGRRALTGQIRPLALRLEAQLRPAFLARGFPTPALQEVTNDRFGWRGGSGENAAFAGRFPLGHRGGPREAVRGRTQRATSKRVPCTRRLP